MIKISTRFVLMGVLCTPLISAQAADQISVKRQNGKWTFLRGKNPMVTYVYNDSHVGRPYFFDLFTPGGLKVTRNHPPQKGDDQDHPHHTGIFFTFGDLNGIDFWHLKGKTRFEGFNRPLTIDKKRRAVRFAVKCSYSSPNGKLQFLTSVTQHEIKLRRSGFSISYDVLLTGGQDGARIGSKEEGGLAARVATVLAATSKKGGYLIDNQSRRGGKLVWGKQAAWVDYRGTANGKSIGLLLAVHPKNTCWWHARDYGLFAANPFGPLNARGKVTTLKKGQKLRLRYQVVVHEGPADAKLDARRVYADIFK